MFLKNVMKEWYSNLMKGLRVFKFALAACLMNLMWIDGTEAKTYDWILFDADETLFSFDSYTGLHHMFSGHGYEFTRSDYEEYQALNKSLWVELQKGSITQKELQVLRFRAWAEKLNEIRKAADASATEITPSELNDAFLDSMAVTSAPLAGAMSLLESLRGRVKIGLITNGFTRLQEKRLLNLGVREFFDLIVISEQVGLAKPHREIFDYALTRMGDVSRDRVLMVGDTPESDILGGMNAELDTFWINHHGKTIVESIRPTYTAGSLPEVQERLLKLFKE